MKVCRALNDAIENLYKGFSRYPLRKHVEGCPCCVHEEDKLALESKPLRKLTAADLGRYSFKAMTTWGDKDDFRHFLPRIFELLVSEVWIGWDEEIVLGKLALAEWSRWPVKEQAAVRDYFRAVWNSLLTEPELSIGPDGWLCGMGRAGEDLQKYLDDWAELRTSDAYEHLARFVELIQPTYVKRRSLGNAFWTDCPQAVAQLCNWLVSLQTREKLEAIYFENQTSDFSAALARAIDQLELIAKA
jgi:hypothetical protein